MRDKRRTALYRGELVHPERFDDVELVWYRSAFDSVAETRPPIRYYKERRRGAAANAKRAREAAKITIPVLVLWGEQDKHLIWQMAAESCAQVEPGKCRAHVFADAGHWPQWDAPDGVVAQWRAFVDGASMTSGASPGPGDPAGDGTSPASP